MEPLIMNPPRTEILLSLAALFALLSFVAAPAAESDRSQAAAEIRIDLPADAEPYVTVSRVGDRIRIEMPEGAAWPEDLVAASGGFLGTGRSESVGNGRVSLELSLFQGVLDRVEYRPSGVSLHFSSRFSLAEGGAEGSDYYRLGPDDQVQVTVFEFAELSTTVAVGKTGTITVPLLGDVRAAGLTTRELAGRLADRLEDYVVNPQVDVVVAEYRSQWVMVTGEVGEPGRIALRGGTDLKEALTEAKGFRESAGEVIKISRRANGIAGPAEVVVDRQDFERGQNNPMLKHGDIITIDRAAYCFVEGEVEQPGKVQLERGMTLLRAISEAGGLSDWANHKLVRMRRAGEEGPGTLHNLKRIRRGQDPDPLLTGGELITVHRRTL
jgi:polysaccharide export outer membrane protein